MQEPPLSPPNLIHNSPSGRPSFHTSREALMKDTGECVLTICVNELTAYSVERDGLQLTLSCTRADAETSSPLCRCPGKVKATASPCTLSPTIPLSTFLCLPSPSMLTPHTLSHLVIVHVQILVYALIPLLSQFPQLVPGQVNVASHCKPLTCWNLELDPCTVKKFLSLFRGQAPHFKFKLLTSCTP